MKNSEQKKGFGTLFTTLVIPILLAVAIILFKFVFGDPSHFLGNNPENQPVPGDFFGVIYKGGFIVPILMTCLMMVLTFSIERLIAIGRAKGKGSSASFVHNLKASVAAGNIEEAEAACKKQRGALGNVCYSVLQSYKYAAKDTTMTKDQKLVSIQKNVEEATSLELPTLEQNLVILATLSSVSTLIGLLGTVIGMIRAFGALANAGSPDSVALSAGISEALINTALGIGSAAVAIIFYNVFTTQIDKITYNIDEAGYSMVQTFAEKH
jgi:biopolymer transport protein ExbB